MEKVRVAVIGAGRAANRFHYPSIRDMSDVDLVGICDLDAGRLNETADRWGLPQQKRFANYHDMIDRVSPDAVYVIMEPKPGTPIVLDVLAKRKHVFMEKPPGMNLADTEKLSETAKANNVTLQIGWNRRFAPVIREAARKIREMGAPTLVMGEFHKDLPKPQPYYGTGSWLISDQSHTLDTIWFLGGPITKVVANTRSVYGFVDDNTALFNHESGAAGVFMANYTSGARIERFEIHCRDGGAYMEAPQFARIYRRGQAGPEVLDGPTLAGSNEFYRTYGYFQENRHFIDCLKEGKQPETNIHYAVELIRLIGEIETAGTM